MCARVCMCVRACVCAWAIKIVKHKITVSTLLLNQVSAVGWYMPGFSKLLIAPVIELVQGCDLIIKAHLEFLLNKAKR